MTRLKLRLGLGLGNQELPPEGGILTNIYPLPSQSGETVSRPPAMTIPVGLGRYASVDVPEGRYLIEAILPSGELVVKEVAIDGPTAVELPIEGVGELLGWQYLLGNIRRSASYAATDLNSWARAAMLVAVARSDRSSQHNQRIKALAADLDDFARAWVLGSLSNASIDERGQVLSLLNDVSPNIDLAALGEILEVVIDTEPRLEILERLVYIIQAAAGFQERYRTGLLASIARIKPPLPLLERLLAIAESGSDEGDQEALLLAIARADPPIQLLERLLDISETLPSGDRESLLTVIARADLTPGQRRRVVDGALSDPYGGWRYAELVAVILQTNRQQEVLNRFIDRVTSSSFQSNYSWVWSRILLSIAQIDPRPSMLERVQRAAANLPLRDQASVLLAIAEPDDRSRVAIEIEASAADLRESSRSEVLVEIVRGHSTPDDQERIFDSTAHFRSVYRRNVLTEIAKAGASPELLERILAAIPDIHPVSRSMLLAAVVRSGISPEMREQVIAATLDLSTTSRRDVWLAIIEKDASLEMLEKAFAATATLDPEDRSIVLTTIVKADPPLEIIERIIDVACFTLDFRTFRAGVTLAAAGRVR